jgi:hypothetical protein
VVFSEGRIFNSSCTIVKHCFFRQRHANTYDDPTAKLRGRLRIENPFRIEGIQPAIASHFAGVFV